MGANAMKKEKLEKEWLPATALRGMTILPEMIIHFDLSRKKSIQAIETAMTQDQRVFLITQKKKVIY